MAWDLSIIFPKCVVLEAIAVRNDSPWNSDVVWTPPNDPLEALAVVFAPLPSEWVGQDGTVGLATSGRTMGL